MRLMHRACNLNTINTWPDFLGLAVVLEVCVVGYNQDRVCGVPHEMLPVPKSTNDSQQFPVVNRVVLFSFVESLRVES